MSEGARTKTGILGLDEVLEGGLPRNYVHSVVGAPGAGKTVMGAQFLFRGATQYAENGVYVSLEEPTHSFANNMLRFNWNMFDLESQGKLVLLDAAPQQEEPGGEMKIRGGVLGTEKFDLDGLVGVIANARKRVAAKRCVIDSLSSIAGVYLYSDSYRYTPAIELSESITHLFAATRFRALAITPTKPSRSNFSVPSTPPRIFISPPGSSCCGDASSSTSLPWLSRSNMFQLKRSMLLAKECVGSSRDRKS